MEDFKELIQTAKEEAAKTRWYLEYQNAVDDCERGVKNGGCNLGSFQLVTDKAMEIVAKNAYNQALIDATEKVSKYRPSANKKEILKLKK